MQKFLFQKVKFMDHGVDTCLTFLDCFSSDCVNLYTHQQFSFTNQYFSWLYILANTQNDKILASRMTG